MKNKCLLLILVFFTQFGSGISQTVYQHVSSKSIYEFLDEMANERFIEINSAVKPYSREFIAQKLTEIMALEHQLNQRQMQDLKFYLRDYNKELQPNKKFDKRFDVFYFKDSLFTFSLNAILGIEYWNNANGSTYHRWNGLEVFSYVGKHLGVYANLRDNHDDAILSDTNYLDTRPGSVYKSGQDYSEMRGGITWSWKWGTIGLIKDHTEWGNNYHYPSIVSTKAPSFAQIKLNIKPVSWFEFNYFHGWLVSTIIDSSRSYFYTNSYGSGYREVFRKKYMAGNLFTFKPFKGFYASIGNSIVYGDVDIQPAFLIPVLFYKSVDHTLINAGSNALGQNSQLFMDFSSRQIKHLHLYASIYMDDISFTRFKENKHFDYYSLNTGFQLSDLLPNTQLTFEFFQSYPLVYKHDMPTTTYETNRYTMGHYLQDNSRGIYAEIKYRPIRGLNVIGFYNHAWHGPDHESLGTDREEVTQLFLDEVIWESRSTGIKLNYQLLNDLYLNADFTYSNTTGEVEKYTAELFRGKTSTLHLGINFGF